MLAALLATFHYLGLALGFGAVYARGIQFERVLESPDSKKDISLMFFADNCWGIAALLWIATGLLRAFTGIEKTSDFYLLNGFFWLKIGLFLGVFAMEWRPMLGLIRWRLAIRNGQNFPAAQHLPKWIRLNRGEFILICLIPFAASAMARGLWLF